jgi:hypothetical protein
MEMVEAGSKNSEVAVMERDSGLRILSDEEVRPPACPATKKCWGPNQAQHPAWQRLPGPN